MRSFLAVLAIPGMTATPGCVAGSAGPAPAVVMVAALPPPAEVVTAPASPPSSGDVASRVEPSQPTFRPEPAAPSPPSPPPAAHPDLTPGAAAKLPTGLPVDIVVEAEVTSAGGAKQRHPAGACMVTFDLRDEVYRLRHPSGRVRGATTVRAVVDACTDSQAFQAAKSGAPSGSTVRRIVREK